MPSSRSQLSLLRKTLQGTVLESADPGFEDARVLFNTMITTQPAAIAQVAAPAEVATAIRFARDHQIPLAVRSGGHSVAGHSLVENGLVIDMRQMASIAVDPVKRTVRVGGGATWGPVDRATQAHGLSTTGGRVTTTGVAGYTLGGGNGWLDRTFGLAVDNVLSIDLVTADGRQVTASADEHPDLFWALRGGGGNFGVATSFTFRLSSGRHGLRGALDVHRRGRPTRRGDLRAPIATSSTPRRGRSAAVSSGSACRPIPACRPSSTIGSASASSSVTSAIRPKASA